MKLIPLSQGYCAQVDDEDYARLINLGKWHWHKGYAYRKINRKTVGMHQIILPVASGLELDHRDRDGLNNTKANLRAATKSQNQGNSLWTKPKVSKFKGVCFDKWAGKWRAFLRTKSKRLNLGHFVDEEAAAHAYDKAAIAYFGSFARVNFSG